MPAGFLNFFKETEYVALIYVDTLRDNFVGYTPTDQAAFDAIHAEFLEMANSNTSTPWLADLFKIEIALVHLMPDATIKARFWSIDDRFRRVVPASIVDHYDKSVPAKGDAMWADASFIRDQARTLLDVIHANYLINIGREKSVKRLKTIIALAALFMLFMGSSFGAYQATPLKTGFLMIIGAGILGALLSIINRLQSVTAADAMANDGIYELTGLRVGWVGILMSFALGGGFALVLYAIVMAGLLQVATPTLQQSGPENIVQSQAAGVENLTDPLPEASVSNATSLAHASASADPLPSGIVPQASESESDPKNADAIPATCRKDINSGPCLPWANGVAAALGFTGAMALFKMLVLAFLSGFAERFVPDILNRLRKDVQ